MANSGYCRLCAEIKLCSNLMTINKSEDEFSTNLYYKISQCFQIQIESDDNLPKTICLDCCAQTNVTYEYFQKVHRAQEFLRNVVFNTIIRNENFTINLNLDSVNDLVNDNLIIKTKAEDDQNSTENAAQISEIDIADDVWDNESSGSLNVKNDDTSVTKSEIQNENRKKSDHKNENCKKTKRIKKKDGTYVEILRSFEEEWKDYIWRCNMCSKKLKTRKELIEHFQEIHNKSPEYSCLDCSKNYTQFKLFTRHVRTHKNFNKFRCDMCGKVFHDKAILRKHMRFVHEQTQLSKYVCTVCGKVFKWPGSFKYHKLNFHVPDEKKLKYECDICHKKVATEKSLMTHREVHDESTKKFTCEQCGLNFRQIYTLKSHVKNVHTEHNKDNYLQCSLCPQKLKHEIQLRRHKRQVHCTEKRFECETCGKKFYLLSQFKLHVRLHTGERPFECEYCKKRFRRKPGLENHIRQHTGEKPYCCFDCDHFFTDFANYIKHMKRKHGVTSFKNVKKVKDLR